MIVTLQTERIRTFEQVASFAGLDAQAHAMSDLQAARVLNAACGQLFRRRPGWAGRGKRYSTNSPP